MLLTWVLFSPWEQAQAQAKTLKQVLEACGCQTVELSQLQTDNKLRASYYVGFSPANLLSSFDNHPKAQNALKALVKEWPKQPLPNRAFLANIEFCFAELRSLPKGRYSQDLQAKKISIVSAVAKDKNADPWLVYTACEFARILHEYYQNAPDQAPKGFQVLSNETNNNANNNASNKLSNSLTMEAFIPSLIVGAGVLFIVFIVMLIQSRQNAKTRKGPQGPELFKNLSQVPEFQQSIQDLSQAQSLRAGQQIANQMQQHLQRMQDNLQELRTKLEALEANPSNNHNQDIQNLKRRIDNIPIIDVKNLQELLQSMQKDINELKRRPSASGGNLQINLSPEELAQWISDHPEVSQGLSQALGVEVLRDTIMRLLPKQLEGSELDALERQTLQRFWRLYELDPQYLPKFKKELLQSLKK